jgi:dihydroflavonol-4-reductase
MRVLVTGGTGFVGAHSVAAIVRAGHQVRLLARDPGSVARALGPVGVVEPDSVEVVRGDMTDAALLRRIMAGVDGVLHAGAVYSFDSRAAATMRAVNAAGTAAVLGEARRAGCDPIVHVSSIVALLPTEDDMLSTRTPVGTAPEPYFASKQAAERIARRHQAGGAPVTITYPSALLGPHDPKLGDQTARLRNALRGLLPVWPTGGFPIGDVRDTAALHAALMEPGQGPRRVFAPGVYVSTRDLVGALRGLTGRALPTAYLPARALLPLGRLASAAQQLLPATLPVEYGGIYTCATAVPLAEVTAGRSLVTTLHDTIRWLYGEGLISTRQAGWCAEPAPPPDVSRVDGAVAGVTR